MGTSREGLTESIRKMAKEILRLEGNSLSKSQLVQLHRRIDALNEFGFRLGDECYLSVLSIIKSACKGMDYEVVLASGEDSDSGIDWTTSILEGDYPLEEFFAMEIDDFLRAFGDQLRSEWSSHGYLGGYKDGTVHLVRGVHPISLETLQTIHDEIATVLHDTRTTAEVEALEAKEETTKQEALQVELRHLEERHGVDTTLKMLRALRENN